MAQTQMRVIPKVAKPRRVFCGDRDRGCGSSLTSTDLENGACTQCGEPLVVPEFPMEQALLLSLFEAQSQREAVRG